MLRSEAGLLVGYVYVDLEPWKDLGGYVDDARARVDAAIARGELPMGPGMYLRWTGQYEVSVSGAGEAIELPRVPGREVHHEAELAIVIGKQCRGITREQWQSSDA